MSHDVKNNEDSISLENGVVNETFKNDATLKSETDDDNLAVITQTCMTNEMPPDIPTTSDNSNNALSISIVPTPKVSFPNSNRIRIISSSDLIGRTIFTNGTAPKVISLNTSGSGESNDFIKVISGKTIRNIQTLPMSTGASPAKIIRIKSDTLSPNKVSISSLNPVTLGNSGLKKIVTIQSSNIVSKPPIQLQMNRNSMKLNPKSAVNNINKSMVPSNIAVKTETNSGSNFILLTPTTMSFASKPVESTSSLLRPISNSKTHDGFENSDFNGRKGHRMTMNSSSSNNSSTWQQYVRQYAHLGPCPICEDSISGYHYGIFCCESCKGFFKRSVQNQKDYICHVQQSGGEPCGINKHTRKKCPSCRFSRCVEKGMRIEAVRNDRSRGGRSLYPGSRNRIHRYSFPDSASEESQKSPTALVAAPASSTYVSYMRHLNPPTTGNTLPNTATTLQKNITSSLEFSRNLSVSSNGPLHRALSSRGRTSMMSVLDNIVVIEEQLQQERDVLGSIIEDDDMAVYRVLLKLAEQRLHRMVRWSRALPEFSAIDTDDQIMLVQNCWAELLILDCCYRSLGDPREIHLTAGKCINLEAACELGAKDMVEFIVRTTQKLKSLCLDIREYACLKVLLLMQPDLRHLKAEGRVRLFQETVSQLLLDYTHQQVTSGGGGGQANTTGQDKYYELVRCVPEIRAAAQSLKEMLATKDLGPFLSSNSLLLELLNCNNSVSGASAGASGVVGASNGGCGSGPSSTTVSVSQIQSPVSLAPPTSVTIARTGTDCPGLVVMTSHSSSSSGATETGIVKIVSVSSAHNGHPMSAANTPIVTSARVISTHTQGHTHHTPTQDTTTPHTDTQYGAVS